MRAPDGIFRRLKLQGNVMRTPKFVPALLLCLVVAVAGAQEEKVSRPFEYSGYSTAAYASHAVSSAYVPMSDGEKLAVDIFVPKDGPERTAFPVIVEYLPYQRATIDPATGEIKDAGQGREGKFFLGHGYVLVQADMRGTGASTGSMMDFMPQLQQDGLELIDWIAAQPWCDGNVGMKGSSYLGWSQLATANKAPKALKCIVPQCVPLDGYTGEAYPGGIFLQGFFDRFTPFMKAITTNMHVPSEGIRPTKPVVDEDGDGKLEDEIPLDVNGNGTFLDDGFPPQYADGQTRSHFYYQATLAHTKNLDYTQWASERPFLDMPTPMGMSMAELSPSAFVPGIMASKVPMYHVGGWFDAFTRGTMELYATMAASNPSKLVVGPSYHDFTSGPLWKHFGIEDPEAIYLTEHLRFFDRYLKNVENGIDAEAPVMIYVMNGAGWRAEQEWPLARQVVTTLRLDAGNALAPERGAEGTDAYTADLTHDSSYTESKGNRYVGIVMQDPTGPPMRTALDGQCLGYTGAPLAADLEVTGHPVVHLHVSCTTPDADFFVYLEDVDANGEAALVTEGQLRAGFAGLKDNNVMVQGGAAGVNVLPELPWHGFTQADYNGTIFADGAVVALTLDLNPTSWVFKAGHRVRVSIALADWPTFRLHPAVSPKNDPKDGETKVPKITVYRDAAHDSRIELPVIPAAG